MSTRDGRRLVVLAGPTAVGKGTVAAHIRDHHPEILLSVSATTRAPRPGEVEGEHYYFVDDAEFDRLIAEGELLEWAVVHNKNRYGTPRAPIERVLAHFGKFNIDGFLQMRLCRDFVPGLPVGRDDSSLYIVQIRSYKTELQCVAALTSHNVEQPVQS